jgi:hypothetical protein
MTREFERIHAANAGAEQQREQLGVGERFRAALQQFFRAADAGFRASR